MRNVDAARVEARAAEADSLMCERAKDRLAAAQAVQAHLQTYDRIAPEQVEYQLTNMKERARAVEMDLEHTTEGARRHETAFEKLRETLGAIAFIRKARISNQGGSGAKRDNKRVDLYEALILVATRSGALQTHAMASMLLNNTDGAIELLDDLMHAPLSSARQIMEECAAQARRQHESAQDLLAVSYTHLTLPTIYSV